MRLVAYNDEIERLALLISILETSGIIVKAEAQITRVPPNDENHNFNK